MRAHLSGERVPGLRVGTDPDPFGVIEPYVRQRLVDDPHVWATVLFDEVGGLGYEQSYPTFVRQGTQPAASSVVWGVCGHQGTGDGGDRSSACRRVPVGLAGAAGHPVAVSGVCAGWCAVVFGQVPGVDHREPRCSRT